VTVRPGDAEPTPAEPLCDWCFDPIRGVPMTVLDDAGQVRLFHPADVANCHKDWRVALR
jgi:hypothetical protein